MDKHINDQKEAALSEFSAYSKNALGFYSKLSVEFGRQNKEWMAQNQNSDHFAKDFHERLQTQEKMFDAHKQMDVNVLWDALKHHCPDVDSESRRNDSFDEQERGPFFMSRDMQIEGHFMSQLRQGAEQTSGSQRHILLAFSAGHEARLVEITQGYARLRELEQEWFNDPNEVKPAGKKEAYPPLSNDVMQLNVGTPAECRLEGLRQARIASLDEETAPSMIEAVYDNIERISNYQKAYEADNVEVDFDDDGRLTTYSAETENIMLGALRLELFKAKAASVAQVEEAKASGQGSAERPQWSQIRGAQVKEWLKGREQDAEQSKDMSQSREHGM